MTAGSAYRTRTFSAPAADDAGDAPGWVATAACAALVIVPAVGDLTRPGVNGSILFLLPLVLCALVSPARQTVRRATALLVVLTYACYAAKATHHDIGFWTYRLLNRTFVAAALVVAGGVLDQVIKHMQARRWLRAEATDADQPLYEAILTGSHRLLTGAAACAVALLLFAVDLSVPGQYNLPILFSIPLLLAVWTRSRAWTWTIAAVLVALAIAGWLTGRAPTVPADVLPRLLTNRSLACVVLIALAAVLQARTAPAR